MPRSRIQNPLMLLPMFGVSPDHSSGQTTSACLVPCRNIYRSQALLIYISISMLQKSIYSLAQLPHFPLHPAPLTSCSSNLNSLIVHLVALSLFDSHIGDKFGSSDVRITEQKSDLLEREVLGLIHESAISLKCEHEGQRRKSTGAGQRSEVQERALNSPRGTRSTIRRRCWHWWQRIRRSTSSRDWRSRRG